MATRKTGARGSATGTLIGLPYIRVSTDEQEDDGLSLPAQRERLLTYIAERGWTAQPVRCDVETGTKATRAEYQALLSEARQLAAGGQRFAVVIIRADRLGRKLSEFARAYEELADAGGTIHSVREGGELSALNAGILGTLAQEESRRIGERVRDVIDHVERGGWWFPGRAPWGYRAVPAMPEQRAAGAPRSVLVVDAGAAAAVRTAFRRLADGEPLRRVAKWVAGLNDAQRGGRRMGYESVRTSLRSPTYAGRQSDGTPGTWEPLVDADTWEAAQVRLRRATGGDLPHQARGEHLLTGFLRCHKCGARMHGNHMNGRPGYRCQAGQNYLSSQGDIHCNATVSAHLIEPALLAKVEPIIAQAAGALRSEFEAVARQALEAPADDGRVDVRREREGQRAELQRELTGLTRALARGVLSDDAYRLAVADVQAGIREADIALLDMDQAEGAGAGIDVQALIGTAEEWRQDWRDANLSTKRGILSELVSTVRADLSGHARNRTCEADVSWTVTGEYLRSLLGLSTPGE